MKMRLFVMAILVSLLFTSCQITENVYLEEDGSGKIAFDVDASGLMEIVGGQLGEAGNKNVDSTFTFKQLFHEKKDSISKLPQAEQDRLKKLENMSVNMKMNPVAQEFKLSLFSNFKKADELQDMMEALKSMKDFEKKAEESANSFEDMMQTNGNVSLKYAYDGKTFKRMVKIIDPKLQEQRRDTTGIMKMMFASSQYTIKYHFPRKVKSVSDPKALFSEDRKTVTIPYALSDYIAKPEVISFEVVLDKK